MVRLCEKREGLGIRSLIQLLISIFASYYRHWNANLPVSVSVFVWVKGNAKLIIPLVTRVHEEKNEEHAIRYTEDGLHEPLWRAF